ncbi:hypothetical protein IV102_35055 [bacterium]|nr:hypothetical protein [bacterium]
MGLDVYVGSFTRYYCRDWQLITQQTLGENVRVVRLGDQDDDPPDRDEALCAARSWREALNRGKDYQLDWEEDPTGPYFTDKPAWDAHGSLMLWFAYAAQPKMKRPQGYVDDWSSDPAFRACARKGWFGPKNPQAAFGQMVLGCEWWLPCQLPGVLCLDDIGGNEKQVGSSIDLLKQLDDLNARTWQADKKQLQEWVAEGVEYQAPMELGARFALSVFHNLAQKSIEHRLPMLLDY